MNNLMTKTEFCAEIRDFGMGQLKYMHRIIQTKPMIHYYGQQQAKIYRNLIYDYIISRKIRGVECEVWE